MQALLANGRAVEIAQACPDDFDRVRVFYEQLSDSSTYFRFFGIRRRLPTAELQSVVAQDVPHHVTLLASTDGELIGIGEFIVGSNLDEADVAFAVADDHHREGIATLLLERLAVIGRRYGLKRFVAQTLPANRDMLLVFRTVGLTEEAHFDGGVVEITLDLTTLDRLEVEAEMRYRHAVSMGPQATPDVPSVWAWPPR
ncbi:MAG: GNAT family N-acetyltransferase [Ilumatobacteraceae bacterium]